MTPALRARIAASRAALAADPAGIVAGEVRPGCSDPSSLLTAWSFYFEFLREADGGRFGSIDVFSNDECEGAQYPAVEFPGGQDRWWIIGQVVYEPLALEANTGHLRLFRRDGQPKGEDLGLFDDFFVQVVFGVDYPRVVPDGEQDEWWAILEAAGMR